MEWVWGVLPVLGPLLLGGGFYWVASKCRGRNARHAFNFAAWGSWLLLLHFVIPSNFLWPLTAIVWWAPSVILFLLAGNSILKEMRAQRQGEFTDAA